MSSRLSALLAFAGAVLLTVGAAFAAESAPATPTSMTLVDVAGTRLVREAKIAPDGGAIAYLLGVPRAPWKDDDGAAWAELHVVDRQGRDRGFVTGKVNVSHPVWTPDGREIAFLAKRAGDEKTALYTIARDGGEARRRLTFATDIESFDLAPDGKRVAFLARDKKPEAIETREKKGFDREVFEEEWQPVRVRISELDATAEPRTLELSGSGSELHWSPSGERLAVALAPTPSIDDEYMARQVRVVSVAEGTISAAVEHAGKLGTIGWSPDGSHLALIHAVDRHDPSTSQLSVVGVTGGRPRALYTGTDGHPVAFAWTGASSVAAIVAKGVGTEVVVFPLAGGTPTPVLPSGRTVWSGLDRAGDGTLALIGESPRHPAEIFVTAAGAGEPQRLTDSNPWLAERRLAKQRSFTWKAKDGLELEGLLIEPLTPPASGKSPLVVVVHGGPEGHFSDGWLTAYANPGQVLAGKGFAVFYPNYRGSTGRGLAFSKTSQGDPAGKEFSDLVDGVDALLRGGTVDAKRVGITGGSYGGYATAWGATYYSERFAAGVMFVGISDLTFKAGTTEIPVEDIDVHLMTPPWTRWELNRQRSPLTYVDKAKTPLLILHGTADPRVHPTQSLALYRYLKLRGQTPVRLVRYPGEGHGNRRAASRLDLSLRLVEWFEHYLLGPGGAPPPAEIDVKTALGISDETK